MTRKNVNTKPVLAIRRRPANDKTSPNMYIHEQFAPDSAGETASFNNSYPQMYHFGDGANAHIVFAGGNTLLPYTEPTMQFPAPAETPGEESPQQHLFYSFIAAELNAYGVSFGGYLHPFMNDLVADEYNQPLMASPDAGESVRMFIGRCTDSAFNRA